MNRVVTIGCDPEIPILKNINTTRATMIPACGLFGGEKGNPLMLDEDTGGWLEDGVMLELNPKPDTNPQIVGRRIAKLMKAATVKVRGIKKDYGLFPTGSIGYFDVEELRSFKQAMTFGCEPDFDGYQRGAERTGVMDRVMEQYGEGIRLAGGHVHIGVSDWPEELPKWIAVRFLDLLLGLPIMRGYGEYADERTGSYGLPGIYRTPSYGIEYRTLSNKWLRENETGEWHTLARAKAVGNLFAHFEQTKEELVDLYNKIDWNYFYEGLKARDYNTLYKGLSRDLGGLAQGSVIVIAGRGFDIKAHNRYLSPDLAYRDTDLNPTQLVFANQLREDGLIPRDRIRLQMERQLFPADDPRVWVVGDGVGQVVQEEFAEYREEEEEPNG